MRAHLASMSLVAVTACRPAPPPPPPPVYARAPVRVPPPPTGVRVTVERAVGDFDRALLERNVRDHARRCLEDGPAGTARLELVLADRPDRRGMRVMATSGDPALAACLAARLPVARWPTGRLDGIARFTVVVVTAPARR
ncbi:MAG: hypothetical protein R3B06_13570 [Kofleriaceae bacterium]